MKTHMDALSEVMCGDNRMMEELSSTFHFYTMEIVGLPVPNGPLDVQHWLYDSL